jgi:hypothetical protein
MSYVLGDDSSSNPNLPPGYLPPAPAPSAGAQIMNAITSGPGIVFLGLGAVIVFDHLKRKRR